MKKTISLIAIGIFLGTVTVFAAGSIFSDVPTGEWYSNAVNNLQNLGIVEGYEDGTFKPHEDISRAEMAVIIDRTISHLNGEDLSNYYVSENFGIKFLKTELFNDDIVESENGIGFAETGDRIKVFYKDEEQSIEDAILGLIANEGKDASNCIIERIDGNSTENGRYIIELANKDIEYTEDELARIAEAEADATADGGPFNGEWMESKIYNEHLIDLCTEYADPAGLGTSKSIKSYFEYNDYKAPDRYVFFEETYSPEFYEWGSLEFI